MISYICLKLSEHFHSSMLFEPARKWESTSTRVRINVGRSLQKRLTVLRTCRSSSHLLLAVIIATATATVTRISVHATSGPANDHGMCSVKKVHMEVQSMSFLWKRAMGNYWWISDRQCPWRALHTNHYKWNKWDSYWNWSHEILSCEALLRYVCGMGVFVPVLWPVQDQE